MKARNWKKLILTECIARAVKNEVLIGGSPNNEYSCGLHLET